MNKKLFEKVKGLCKDTGLSEKYLKAITEKLGGSVDDDSTDEAAIDEAANLVAELAKDSQGEATRWANAIKNKAKKAEEQEGDDDGDDAEGEKKRTPKHDDHSDDERIKALEEEIAAMKAKEQKDQRATAIASAMEKHKIPAFLRASLTIPDDADVETAVAELKQNFITNGLMTEDQGGVKVASEKQVDEAADNLLESITVK